MSWRDRAEIINPGMALPQKQGPVYDMPDMSEQEILGVIDPGNWRNRAEFVKAPTFSQKSEQYGPSQQETPGLNKAANLGAAYADARTFGLGPKIAAGLGSVLAKPVLEGAELITGNAAPSIPELYKSGVQMYSGFGKQAFKDTPVLATGVSIAGGLKGAKGVANTKAGTAFANWASRGNIAGRVAKGAAGGALGGSVYGAGSSDVGDELSGATKGASTGAVLGAALPAVGGAIGKLNTKISIPGSDEIKKVANSLYQKAESFGGSYKPKFTDDFIEDARKSLLSDDSLVNSMKSNAPLREAFSDLEIFQGQPMTLTRAQALDEQLGNMVDNFSENGVVDKTGLKILQVQRKFRESIENAPDDLLEGGKEGFEALKEGRKLWSTQRRLADIEKVLDMSSTYTVPATAIKTGFRRLYNNAKASGYSKEETKALKKAAETGIITDVFATFGSRLAPLGAAFGGPQSAILGYGTSAASRGIATASQTARANKAARTVAERSGLVKETEKIPLGDWRKILLLPPKEAEKALRSYK